MMKKQCIAMLLAGGQGSRLGILTHSMAKPAVPFGGKYRIIDFPLSNCTNSEIDVVGVLTQYQPLELNTYIGNGQPWDLDRTNGGVFILPPFMKSKTAEWYSGTANAIYQNIGFVDQYDPEYVLVLSGDHIYKMDYAKMLQAHIAAKAEATIAVIQVPWEEAPRFGIMNTDDENRITEFEEKPKKPRSNKASMGVYIFNWQTLRRYLEADEHDPRSSKDFGKNIVPKMLSDGLAMFAHPFEGYWKDVGTIQSLWDAHMDLLQQPPLFNLHQPTWRIYARNRGLPPHFIGAGGRVVKSMVTEGCVVKGEVIHSVLFAGAEVAEGAIVEDSVIMPNVSIGPSAIIRRAIVAEGASIGAGCRVGEAELPDGAASPLGGDGGITVIGTHVQLPPGLIIESGAQIDERALGERMAKEVG